MRTPGRQPRAAWTCSHPMSGSRAGALASASVHSVRGQRTWPCGCRGRAPAGPATQAPAAWRSPRQSACLAAPPAAARVSARAAQKLRQAQQLGMLSLRRPATAGKGSLESVQDSPKQPRPCDACSGTGCAQCPRAGRPHSRPCGQWIHQGPGALCLAVPAHHQSARPHLLRKGVLVAQQHVDLIDDNSLAGAQVQRARLHMGQHAAGRADDHVRAPRERLPLGAPLAVTCMQAEIQGQG